jgi:predicted lipid-binding transport protein (Tim44 family)
LSPLRAIYIGIAAVIALAIWFVAKTRNPAKPQGSEKARKGPPTRQQELFEARNRIRRQIEVLKTSPHAYGAPSQDALGELQNLLRDIEAELKIFGPERSAANAGQD